MTDLPAPPCEPEAQRPTGLMPAPEPSRGRGSRRLPTVLLIVIGVSLLAFLGVGVAGFWVYATHDRIELLDDPVVVARAESACATMTAAVQRLAIDPRSPVQKQVLSVHAQNDAVTAMIADVRRLGRRRLDGDLPSQSWLADWQSLVQAREVYARALVRGRRPQLQIPTVDGIPITQRMNRLGLSCQVPVQLTDLP